MDTKVVQEKEPPEKEAEFSRREFLKNAGAGLFAALAAGNAGIMR